jgi:hypothetical protein
MMEFVERQTFIRDGEIWCRGNRRWYSVQEQPIVEVRSKWTLFYVHPETTQLLEIPAGSKTKIAFDELSVVRRWVGSHELLVKWRGNWFLCEMKPIMRFEANLDLLWKGSLCQGHADRAYGRRMYCARKRQLSRDELRQHELENSPLNNNMLLDTLLGEDFRRSVRNSFGNPLARFGRIKQLC